MTIKIEGTILLEPQITTGVSANGKSWQKGKIVVDTHEEYPNLLPVEAFGDKVKLIQNLNIGQKVICDVNVKGSEYKDKYYVSLNLWKIELVGDVMPDLKSKNDIVEVEVINSNDSEEGNLPF